MADVARAVAAAVTAGRATLRTELSVGMASTLGGDHPVLRELDAFLERFGGGYPVLIAYECERPAPCEGALDPAALEMADAVSRELVRSRFVSRVASPATTPLLFASEALGIEARRLVEDGRAVADPALRQLALEEPLWRRTLISADGRVGVLAVDLVSTESVALISIVEDIERAIAPYRERGFRFHPVGEAVLWAAAHADSRATMLRVGIGTGGLLFLTPAAASSETSTLGPEHPVRESGCRPQRRRQAISPWAALESVLQLRGRCAPLTRAFYLLHLRVEEDPALTEDGAHMNTVRSIDALGAAQA